jgi:hypothetical protein
MASKSLQKKDNNEKQIGLRREKYNPLYVRYLCEGMRYNGGLTIKQVCQKWRIMESTYYDWVNTKPEFARAHEMGKLDFIAYWTEIAHKMAIGEIKGSPGIVTRILANNDRENFAEKFEIDTSKGASINTITIEIAEPKQNMMEMLQDYYNKSTPPMLGSDIVDAEIETVDNGS